MFVILFAKLLVLIPINAVDLLDQSRGDTGPINKEILETPSSIEKNDDSEYLWDKLCERGQSYQLNDRDIRLAYKETKKDLDKIKEMDRAALSAKPKTLDPVLYKAQYMAFHNELATKYLMKESFSKPGDLKNISVSKILGSNQDYCDLESDVSRRTKCNPKDKYRRIDGKCNNLGKTNWGAAYRCQRRILPPDYSDGVSKLRLSSDGSPLPGPRLLTKEFFREKPLISNKTSLNTMWGQLIAHDTFNRINYLKGAPVCCGQNQTTLHPQCIPYDLPPDQLSIAYNKQCANFHRSLMCNTCSLGPRGHINQVTSFLDLSNIYGLNDNISLSLRTLKGGQLKVGYASDRSEILPKAELPGDDDLYNHEECQPTSDRPWLTCLKSGDGIRGNQNPAAAALVIIMVRRHNQHCIQLRKVNPGWNDDRLFQEARRLLIAEYNHINFGEYLPTILTSNLIKRFALNIKKNGFTKYNKNLDPTAIQSVGAAAFRFGHMTTVTTFQVLTEPKYESYGFKLRHKYFEVSDIWDGRTNDIIKGLIAVPEREIGPFMVEDLQDYLNFNRCGPKVADLGAINILRGRDYGLPSYINYLQYASGVNINGWNDLRKFIPDKYLKKLKFHYNDYKDIDLFVGGLLETGIDTFRYLMALQFSNWKFGDRFYFEHSDQSGSFSKDQLNDIRKRSSLANLLCKITDFESIPSKPLFVSSKSNRNVFCRKLKDFNYKLFRE